MDNLLRLALLDELISSNISEHVFEAYVSNASNLKGNLGFIDRSKTNLKVSIADIDLNITQSLTNTFSSVSNSTTGFLSWKAALKSLSWIKESEACPFFSLFSTKNELIVLELGAGTGGMAASILGPSTKCYVATDQKHILGLLSRNIRNNVDNLRSDTIVENDVNIKSNNKYSKKKSKSKVTKLHKSKSSHDTSTTRIEVIEFDWEDMGLGFYNYEQLGLHSLPDMILAFDTIYNEYLVPFFVSALKKLIGPSTGALVGLHLRDELVLEAFLSQLFIQNLRVYTFPEDVLDDNTRSGILMYFITA